MGCEATSISPFQTGGSYTPSPGTLVVGVGSEFLGLSPILIHADTLSGDVFHPTIVQGDSLRFEFTIPGMGEPDTIHEGVELVVIFDVDLDGRCSAGDEVVAAWGEVVAVEPGFLSLTYQYEDSPLLGCPASR